MKRYSLLTLVFAFSFPIAFSQVTLTTPLPTSILDPFYTDPGLVVFPVKNNNTATIVITEVSLFIKAGTSGTYTLWFNTNPAQWSWPLPLDASRNWVQKASVTVNVTTTGIIPLFTGLNIPIPGNGSPQGSLKRLAIVTPGGHPSSGAEGTTPNIASAGNVDIYLQDNPNMLCWVGPLSGNGLETKRSFYGSIGFIGVDLCTNPTGGQAIISSSTVCVGSPVSLDVKGNVLGYNQTYQWQSSPSSSGPWSDIGTASVNQQKTIIAATPAWFRVKVNCNGSIGTSTPVELKTTLTQVVSGTYTIDKTAPTAGRNFNSFNDALKAINCGIPGYRVLNHIVFDVKAGQVFNEDIPPLIFSGTESGHITFQKNGTGDNPKIIPVTPNNSYNSLGRVDGIVVMDGSDYITFDGIDLETNSAFTGNGKLEAGYLFRLGNRSDGCNNIVIKNCTISLDPVSNSATGIYSDRTIGYNYTTPNFSTGSFEHFKINGNLMKNCTRGVWLRSPEDKDMQIGVDSGNEIRCNSNTTHPIAVYSVDNIKIANNRIYGTDTTLTSAAATNLTTAIETHGSAEVFDNIIMGVKGAGISNLWGMDNGVIKIHNNTIRNCMRATIGHANDCGTVLIYSNQLLNNSGDYTRISQSGARTTCKIYDNIIEGNNCAIPLAMIESSNSSDTAHSEIYGNLISGNTVSGSGALQGILINAKGRTEVFNNLITDLTSNSATGRVYGVIVRPNATTTAATNVYNNFISGLFSPLASDTSESIRGIFIDPSNSFGNIYDANVSYNSIYLNATSTGSNFGTAGIYQGIRTNAVVASLVVKNNNIVNMSVANGSGKTCAFRRANPGLTYYQTASNNNNFFAGIPSASNLLYYDGINAEQTLAGLKNRLSPAESNSVSENPPFVNIATKPYDLHIYPNQLTVLKKGAIPIITIKDDYDGDSRHPFTPDIGADEISYVFIKKGNWSNPNNWRGNLIPPNPLPANCNVLISPEDFEECILDITYSVSPDAVLTVKEGKRFLVQGNLTIQ